MHRVLTLAAFFILLNTLNASAWTPGLIDAAEAVANGSATEAQKVFVHIHRGEVSRMALKSKNFQKNVFPKVEKAFNDTNQKDIRDIAEKFECTADAKVSKKGPNPGADTDVAVRPIDPNEKLTVEKIRAMDNYHEDMLKARAKEYGVPFKQSDIDNDFLPDPDYTTDEEFKKIADYINNEKGGTAYRTRKAAKAEIKLSQGKKLTPGEVGEYTREMKWQQQRKVAKNKKLLDDLADARKANDLSKIQNIESKIQLNQSQQAKYPNRVRKLNDKLREDYGLEPLRKNITGADGAIDILDTAGRNVDTAINASTVGALSDSAMRRAQEELADTLIDAGKHFPSARHSLPQVLNDLPPSAQGNMIARMEQKLGAEATTDIVKQAKSLRRGTSKAAREISKKIKSDLNFGKKSEFKGGVTKVQVAMTALNAVMMAKTGYEITLKNIKPDDTDLDMFGKMMANSLYYGSGIGENFDQSMAEEMERFKQAYERGEGPSMTGHITATFLKTGLRMGKDTIFGIMEIPDGIAHLLAWGRDWASGAGALKEYAYAQNALADAMQKVIIEKKAFKEALEMVDKYGVHPEDARAYLNCLCHNCGGSLGGTYNPSWEGNGHGPCVCSGPLSMWKTPVNTSKEAGLKCFNRITKNRYNQDKAIFNKWHKMAVMVNAESVKSTVEEIRSKIATMGENWEKNAIDAAKTFNRIKPMMLDKDIQQIQKVLTPRLINAGYNHMHDKGDLKKAISRLELAQKTGGKEDLIEQRLANYKRSEPRWSDVISKQVPEIKNLIHKGNLNQAMSRMKNVNYKMSVQGGRYYPPTIDPRWLALTDLYNQKSEQMLQERTEAMKKEADASKQSSRKDSSEKGFTAAKTQPGKSKFTGDYSINANGWKGKLTLDKNSGTLFLGRGKETLTDFSFDGNRLVFTRPLVSSTQVYTGFVSGLPPNMSIKGTFTQGGTKRVYQWSAQQSSIKTDSRGTLSSTPKPSPSSTITGKHYGINASTFTHGVESEMVVTFRDLDPVKKPWIGIYKKGAAKNKYLTYQYAPKGAGSGTLIFKLPKEHGDYDVRVFYDGYEHIETSPTITIHRGTYSVEPEKQVFVAGKDKQIKVAYEFAQPGKNDWVGIYKVGADDKEYVSYKYTSFNQNGDVMIDLPKDPGEYELRLFHTGHRRVAVAGQTIKVKPGNASVTPNKSSYTPGEMIIVRFERPLDRSGDWIGIYEPDAPDKKYVSYVNTKNPFSGSVQINAPQKPGTYELRLYHSGYKFVVKSHTFSVKGNN